MDKFKQVNDQHGRDAGDQVLKIVAKRLLHAVREGDTCARLGGDEFVVLSQLSTGVWNPNELKAKLKSVIVAAVALHVHNFRLGSSIGFAHFPSDDKDMSTLLRCADKRMYREKPALSFNAMAFSNPQN